MTAADENRARIRGTVEKCLRAALPPGILLPGDNDDWIESGLLDSMAHVDVLLAIESALKVPKLFGQFSGAVPTTLRAAVETICGALSFPAVMEIAESRPLPSREGTSTAGFVGWGSALGSNRVSVREVEQDFQLSGGPGWIGTERYDIIAKTEGGETPGEKRSVLDENCGKDSVRC